MSNKSNTFDIRLIACVTFYKLCVRACNIYVYVVQVIFCILLNMCCNSLSTMAEQTST